ncbi:prephenate dehydrogenase (NADP(+)) [Tilletia horrida]|uniref:Prephenate dehydrogenase (NADP(+)) n=1 Tax=Tilletia horrida TaxID=155126 RepID=A0AAN6GJX0_9BASI|nr:prephenate dehydrogenase (NADP(+)) [Tilletia horrida]KAK0564883.1 prephenate dehydrogenase (NADP(+)) [Tilletia horrida]
MSSSITTGPSQHELDTLQIGIIGMGDMGRLYARKFAQTGFQHINVCDRAENYEALKSELAQRQPSLTVCKDGHFVSRCSDIIIYSVEAAFLDAVVAQYGPSTKIGAIVSAQTSVKAPEQQAFDKHLPADVSIISCHSLHGPKVDTAGQPLVLIQYRASDDELHLIERAFSGFKSRYVYLSYEEHDVVTANTQAVTHAAFLSMGTAWRCSNQYPWETGLYPRGIETVKINLMLRIYSAKWHVYAGLALLNPAAKQQVSQYADSVTALFKLMIEEDEQGLVERIFAARRAVFGWADDEDGEGVRPPLSRSDTDIPVPLSPSPRVPPPTPAKNVPPNTQSANGPPASRPNHQPILMSDRLLDQFHITLRQRAREALAAAEKENGSIHLEDDQHSTKADGTGQPKVQGNLINQAAAAAITSRLSSSTLTNTATSSNTAGTATAGTNSGSPELDEANAQANSAPNSHLSLLAIVDSWAHLSIDPYSHLSLAATPLFRLWIGVSEYLFRSTQRLRAACHAAVHARNFRRDDTEFVVAARGWAQAVQFGSFELYRWRFEDTAKFFESRFEEANVIGAEMLKVVAVDQGGAAARPR